MWGPSGLPRSLTGHAQALPHRRTQPELPGAGAGGHRAVAPGRHLPGAASTSEHAPTPPSSSSTTARRSPTASMHYGHLFTGYIKDAVPRYRTMRGRPGRAPVRLGLATACRSRWRPRRPSASPAAWPSRSRCTASASFNDECCSIAGSAPPTSGPAASRRQARWGRHMAQRLQDHGPRVHGVGHVGVQDGCTTRACSTRASGCSPYCWECETPLSNFETRMDDAYRQRQDPALTVWFELDNGQRLLVWTTTPWTLPSNLALAVGPRRHLRRARTGRRTSTCSARPTAEKYRHASWRGGARSAP